MHYLTSSTIDECLWAIGSPMSSNVDLFSTSWSSPYGHLSSYNLLVSYSLESLRVGLVLGPPKKHQIKCSYWWTTKFWIQGVCIKVKVLSLEKNKVALLWHYSCTIFSCNVVSTSSREFSSWFEKSLFELESYCGKLSFENRDCHTQGLLFLTKIIV